MKFLILFKLILPSKSAELFVINVRSFIIQTKFSNCCNFTIADNNSSVSSIL